jgi:hypothetical protein
MKKALLLAATVALTGSAVAQQQLRPASAAAQVAPGSLVAQRQMPDVKFGEFGKLSSNVRLLAGQRPNFRQTTMKFNASDLQAQQNSQLAVKSVAERIAQYQMPQMGSRETMQLAGLQLTAAGNGPVNGLDSLYYAVGYFYNGGESYDTETWEMRVSAGQGDTVILDNFMPMRNVISGRTAQFKAVYKDDKLIMPNCQWVMVVSSTTSDAKYDVFFSNVMNIDDPTIEMTVSSDGSSIYTDTNDAYYAWLQPQTDAHVFDEETATAWDGMYAAVFSTDSSIQPHYQTLYGRGTDMLTYSMTYWEMQTQEGKNDTVWFADVIPPFTSSLSEITTYGIRKGNQVTIPYSEVLYTKGAYAINLVNLSNSTADQIVISNIVLTENEDGSFSAPEGASYAYWLSPIEDGKADVYNDEAGYYSAVVNVEYSTSEYTVKAPTPNAEADGVQLYMFTDDEYSPYGPYAYFSAFQPLTYTSTTQAPYDSLYWAMYEYDASASSLVALNTFESTGEKLTVTPGYENMYGSPYLYAWNGGEMGAKNVNAYTYYSTYGTVLFFPYGTSDDLEGYHFSTAQLDRKISRTNYATTDSDGKQVSSIYSYQGKPSSPAYFKSLTVAGTDFTSTSATSSLKLLIRHCSRDAQGNIVPGDTIAISDANISNWRTTSIDNGVNYGFLTFDEFYVEDEDGFTDAYPYEFFNIDDEFLFELQGFDESQLQGYIFSEYIYDENGSKFTGYSTSDAPSVVKYDEYANARIFFCYDDFIYGLLITDDATSINVPADGGVYSWTVYPMYTGNDEDGNVTTGLWTKEGTDPDWIKWDIASEKYTETEASFVLQIAVDALPAGMTGRSCTVQFEQWGAALNIEILQGDATSGIQGVQTEARAYKAQVSGDNIIVSCPADVKNVTLYDATGARVATAAVVGGKAIIPGARQGLNIVNFGGKNSVKVVK